MMEDKNREKNLEYLDYLYEEYKKNPRSILIFYDIINLEQYLGIDKKLPFEINGMTGILTYTKNNEKHVD